MESNNRRNFLKTSAALGSTILAAPILSSAAIATPGPQKQRVIDIKERTLGSGKHSLKVSSLGLGCMGMSWNRTFVPDRKNSISMIRKAHDMGVNFFDTAEAY